MRVLLNLFPPEAKNYPPLFLKHLIDLLIALHIPFYLRNPKFSAGFDIVFSVFPIISVPELAITEYSDLLSDEGYVWNAGDAFDILAVAEATGPEFYSKFHLYFGVLGVNARHIVMDLFGTATHIDDE